MTEHAISIVITSRHRPAALRRCLCALHQQDHPGIELIVVADPAACAALALLADRVKLIPFDKPNISAARNLGLSQAAGEVVAFIDDDAVPEPSWIRRLAGAFNDHRVAAATGFVRGRDGISHLWKAAWVDHLGEDTMLEVDATAATLHAGDARRAVKTPGTNMAFRRGPLMAAGGFDPALHFHLDAAHVDLTLAAAGHLTAVVPEAQVHHALAASERRRADGAPLSLAQIGASTAVFLRRHAPQEDPAPVLARLRAAQRRRLLEMMVDGRLSPPDVTRLLTTLEAGLAEGAARPLPALVPLSGDPPPFRALQGTGPRPGVVLAGGPWSRRRLRRAASAQVEAGRIVTLLCLGPGARPHRMRFDTEGFWEQDGGLFGRSERGGPRFRLARFNDRVCREIGRIGQFRPVGTD